MHVMRRELPFIAVFALANLILHLATSGLWGFHRDELLYVALGRHLDWGYWSNPPLIGLLGTIQGLAPGGGPWLVRIVPALFSSAIVVLIGLLARELGGKRSAVVMACLCVFLSPTMLRVGVLFQPVVVDVLFWTLYTYLLVRYLKTERPIWLWLLGAVLGLGMMNKYLIALLAFATLAVLPFTRHRTLLVSKHLYGAIGLALLIVLPNVFWQIAHDFPVVRHLTDLRDTQLAHVRPADFLVDQLVLHFPVLFVWILGLWFFFRTRHYRVIGALFATVLILLVMLGGKSYYALGLYPMLFAAGAVWLERHARRNLQIGLFAVSAVVMLSISPFAIPFLRPNTMESYSRGFYATTGIAAPLRWEDGRVHELPQDYADMLGWRELAQLAREAYLAAPEPARVLIYGENYGQAGAVAHYQGHALPEPISFSDAYRLWSPAELHPETNTLIYVNDELGEDVSDLFVDIQLIGTLQTPLAREHGVQVYLCQEPRVPLPEFWRQRLASLE